MSVLGHWLVLAGFETEQTDVGIDVNYAQTWWIVTGAERP